MPPIFSSLYTLGMINFESGGINFPAFQKVEGVQESAISSLPWFKA